MTFKPKVPDTAATNESFSHEPVEISRGLHREENNSQLIISDFNAPEPNG